MNSYEHIAESLRLCASGKADCAGCIEDLTDDCYDALKKTAAKAIEELEGMLPRWIPVTERLPESDYENTHAYDVLVYIPKREGCRQHGVYIGKLKGVKADNGSGNFWGIPTEACDWTVWGFSYFEHPNVTHWMPLPKLPKED